MSNAQSPLKKFNELLAKEIERANLYEKNGSLDQAKKQWLDVIEYCRLFAKKTPDLRPAVVQMILQKADKLLDRVRAIESKQRGSVSLHVEPSGFMKDITGEDVPEIINEASTAVAPKRDTTGTASHTPAPRASKDEVEKKFINVGTQNIEVPDDFPLVEITPKDSFKPPSVPPEKMQIDKTRIDVDDKGKPPGKPSTGKPRS